MKITHRAPDFQTPVKVTPGTAKAKPMGAKPTSIRAAAPDMAAVAGMSKGGMVSSASKRADGCAQRGKTKGKVV